MTQSRLSLSRVADLTPAERRSITLLTRVVYPPEKWADWPGHRLQWSIPQWCVRIWGENGTLASYTGIVMRPAMLNGKPLRIGGVGGIKTRPAARGRGYARRGIQEAMKLFRTAPDVAFALLVCEPRLIPYYSALGWREFKGRLLVRQRGGVEEFKLNRVMTHAVRRRAPTSGTIDLCGPPW